MRDHAQLLGFWAACNKLLAARGLPEMAHDEAVRLWEVARTEEDRVLFRSLKMTHCASECALREHAQ
jgi:hypothetical protein